MASSELSIFGSTLHPCYWAELSFAFSFLRTIPCAGFQDVALRPIDRPFPENRLLGPPRSLVLARNPQQGLLGGRLCAQPARLGMLASGPHQDDQQCPQPLPIPSHKCFLPSLTKTELLPRRTPPPSRPEPRPFPPSILSSTASRGSNWQVRHQGQLPVQEGRHLPAPSPAPATCLPVTPEADDTSQVSWAP